MARTAKLQYDKLTFEAAGDGLEQEWPIPHNICSIAFQVTAGTVVRNNVTGQGTVGWTVANGLPQGFDYRNLGGEAIFFTGTEAATMEICYVTGIGN